MEIKKIFLFAIITMLVFMLACTPAIDSEETDSIDTGKVDMTNDGSNDLPDDEAPADDNLVIVPQGDVNIEIADGTIIPSEFSLPLNQESEIVVYNKESTIQRFEVLIYKANILLDIEPGEYASAIAMPSVKGLVQIKLNGGLSGTLTVVE